LKRANLQWCQIEEYIHDVTLFSPHGLPDVIVTDTGGSFTSSKFVNYMHVNGIRHRTAKERLFKEGDNVFIRHFVQNSKAKWISGKVLAKTGPVSYKIELTNGTLVRRHIDHIRRCYMDKLDTEPTENEYDVDIEIPVRDDNEIKPQNHETKSAPQSTDIPIRQYPKCNRREPFYLKDYVRK
jgi:hypothetical protein